MHSIRLHGIYSTALAALLLEHGWQIVQPSEEIQQYTGLEDVLAPFDLDLRDRDDRQGILAFGTRATVNALKEILYEHLLDVIAYPVPAEIGAIYLGLVRKRRSWGYDIDLGTTVGFLPKSDPEKSLRIGEAIRVQVRDLTHVGRQPLVTTQLSVAGRLVVLSQKSGVGVSKEISDSAERERLLALGKQLASHGWGLIWRTGACGRDVIDLKKEIDSLQAELSLLDSHPEEGIPGMLRAGMSTLCFEFPGTSKSALDRWRAHLVPTELGHHKRQAEHTEKRDVGFPSVGESVVIEHVKPDGELILLGRGRVIGSDLEASRITVRREIRGSGLYDGLAVPKEVGDHAVSEFCEGSWKYETCYFTRDGRLKGTYINVNTPIEIYLNRVRYVDLELDVVQRPGEPAHLIDEPDLEWFVGLLSERLIERARAVASELYKS